MTTPPSLPLDVISDNRPKDMREWCFPDWMNVIGTTSTEIADYSSDSSFADPDNPVGSTRVDYWRDTSLRIPKGQGSRKLTLAVLTAFIKAAIVKKVPVFNGTLEQIHEHASVFIISKATAEQVR